MDAFAMWIGYAVILIAILLSLFLFSSILITSWRMKKLASSKEDGYRSRELIDAGGNK